MGDWARDAARFALVLGLLLILLGVFVARVVSRRLGDRVRHWRPMISFSRWSEPRFAVRGQT